MLRKRRKRKINTGADSILKPPLIANAGSEILWEVVKITGYFAVWLTKRGMGGLLPFSVSFRDIFAHFSLEYYSLILKAHFTSF